jgi:immune inhibitor A
MRNIGRFGKFLLALVALALGTQATKAQENPDRGWDNYRTLEQAAIPVRDDIDLAVRLLNITAPAPSTTSPNYEIGQKQEITLVNLDTAKPFTVTAEVRYLSSGLVMWFQEGLVPSDAQLKETAEIFENNIMPVARSYFGSEANPGVDGDPRIHIIHARGVGQNIAGYYDPDSSLPRAVLPISNEREMFVISLDAFSLNEIGSDMYESVLAHEFQHMIHNNVDSNEDAWLDEGLAELSAALTGYRKVGNFAGQFTTVPETQLNNWASSGANYGASYLFMTYFLGRFGEDSLRDLVKEQANGLESLANFFAQRPEKDVDVDSFFADWVIANLVYPGEGVYAYDALPSRLQRIRFRPALRLGDVNLPVAQFGTRYFPINQVGKYTLTLKGAPTATVISTEAVDHFWWSNRGDQSEMRLTRGFDLRQVGKASLQYQLWYDIEEAWDYGFVQISTDGGKTWQPVKSTRSSTETFKNNPYGVAFTGPGTWAEETVDLTPFAGKEILIRFALLTDAGVNKEGMAIDDIRIPEINYTDDMETDDGGWQAEGWARITNALPGRYVVQVIAFPENGTPIVERHFLGTDENTPLEKTLSFEVGNGIRQVVVAVSGLTMFTTAETSLTGTLTQE